MMMRKKPLALRAPGVGDGTFARLRSRVQLPVADYPLPEPLQLRSMGKRSTSQAEIREHARESRAFPTEIALVLTTDEARQLFSIRLGYSDWPLIFSQSPNTLSVSRAYSLEEVLDVMAHRLDHKYRALEHARSRRDVRRRNVVPEHVTQYAQQCDLRTFPGRAQMAQYMLGDDSWVVMHDFLRGQPFTLDPSCDIADSGEIDDVDFRPSRRRCLVLTRSDCVDSGWEPVAGLDVPERGRWPSFPPDDFRYVTHTGLSMLYAYTNLADGLAWYHTDEAHAVRALGERLASRDKVDAPMLEQRLVVEDATPRLSAKLVARLGRGDGEET